VNWLRSLFRTSTDPNDLPLQARFAQVEGDLLNVRAQLDAMQGSLRKLQGKIYRGVSLGDTVESAEPPTNDSPAHPEVREKAALYRAAAQLRGR